MFSLQHGFKKWGMTTSNVAANIICDKILGKSNPYEDIFLSTRFKPIKNGTEFTNMLKQVSNSLVLDKFKIPKDTLNEIGRDEGKIVEVEGNKVGIYRDAAGKFFAIKPVCTHLGCELSWNNLEKTWDCPCHGSRFSYTGKSLYDPSIKDLDLINLD
ncbi:MAG: Rieske 2Fe-2S domain-containing protein [Clostridia bacterium]|nr:Rieske 2Fe-2S domain-containing protein [Clostridia bacterium]